MKKILFVFFLIPFISFSQVQIGQDIFGDFDDDQFGRSITLSSNGNVVAIGAPLNDGNGISSGQVKIYENQSGSWIQLGNSIYGDMANYNMGLSVSLNNDGSIVAIGIPGNDENGSSLGSTAGAVKVYQNQAGVWTQLGQSIFGEFGNDRLGRSVSLNSVGNIVAVTSIWHDGARGQVRVFENIGGTWTQIGSEIEGDEFNDELGWTTKLSSDGNILAVGARLDDGSTGGFNIGVVRIYENLAGTWTQVGQDIEGEASNDQSGLRLSLSADGNIVAISATDNSEIASNSGHVRVYENLAGTWTQIGQDIDGENQFDNFGNGLDISGDGSIIAIGSGRIDENGENSGQVKIYKNQSGIWSQIGDNINGSAVNQNFGRKLDLSADGTILAISSLNTGTSFGSASIYDLTTLLSTKDFTKSSFDLYPNPSKNKINIQLKNPSELHCIYFYNQVGQLVLTSKEAIIDISILGSGSYIVVVETSKGKQAKGLIIE